jgi:hypothetical protein
MQVSQVVQPATNSLAERAVGQASAHARRFGLVSAVAFVVLSAAYFIPLAAGLLTLPSPDVPIGEPWFSMMEVLILLSAPAMVGLMVGIHVWAPVSHKAFSLAAVIFMGMAAAVTCSVHFTILTLSHQVEIAALPWMPSLISFQWPSVAYVLDILAWDFFFPLSVLLAAPVFFGSRLTRSIRILLLTSGVLAIAGLVGAALGDMQVRDIGVVGYAVVFPIAAVLLIRLFRGPVDR